MPAPTNTPQTDTSMYSAPLVEADPIKDAEKAIQLRNNMQASKIIGGMPGTQAALAMHGAGQPYNSAMTAPSPVDNQGE